MDEITRKEAHKRGLKKYYTGRPCIHGHIAQRYVVTGACIPCCNTSMQRMRNHFKKNPGPTKIRLTIEVWTVEDIQKVNTFLKGLEFEHQLTAIANGYNLDGTRK